MGRGTDVLASLERIWAVVLKELRQLKRDRPTFALIDPAVEAPEERVRARLTANGTVAQVERVGASLEDVFVAATGFRNGPGH